MSEKKAVSRDVAIALGIACIILIAGIGGAMAYYTMTINNKDSIYDNYASSHSHTDSDYNALNSTYYNYVGNYTHSNSEYDSLLSDYNSLTVASLTTVGLDVTNFNYYWFWDPPSHLTINGYIFNMGTDTAYNCKLHVKVWSSTNTLLIDTTIDYGSITGRSYTTITPNTEVPYTGSGSYWQVTPEWTTS